MPMLAAATLLTGCGTLAPANTDKAAAPPAPPAVTTPQPEPKPVPPPAPEIRVDQGKDPTIRLLAYADRIRQMPPAELSQEIARLGDIKTPVDQLQLSIALGQVRQLPELIRAQDLLVRVLGNPDAAPLHPLARLLASRYGEQRRLEEQLEKQAQQLRDTQRKLDQTNERLEALKAIERSLGSRQPASAPGAGAGPAPANRARTTP
jgi:hypothetical protein